MVEREPFGDDDFGEKAEYYWRYATEFEVEGFKALFDQFKLAYDACEAIRPGILNYPLFDRLYVEITKLISLSSEKAVQSIVHAMKARHAKKETKDQMQALSYATTYLQFIYQTIAPVVASFASLKGEEKLLTDLYPQLSDTFIIVEGMNLIKSFEKIRSEIIRLLQSYEKGVPIEENMVFLNELQQVLSLFASENIQAEADSLRIKVAEKTNQIKEVQKKRKVRFNSLGNFN